MVCYPSVQSPSVQLSRVQAPRVQASSRQAFRRIEPKRPGSKRPVAQSPSVQASRVQVSRHRESSFSGMQFVMVISVVLGSKFQSLRKRPIVLLTLGNTLLRWFSNIFFRKIIRMWGWLLDSRYFLDKIWEILLYMMDACITYFVLFVEKRGCVGVFDLLLKIIYWVCLLRYGLKNSIINFFQVII